MLRFTAELCRDLAAARSREWLETNGLGGFASGTLAGLHTRRYHGLLVAATQPPVGRAVLLAKLEETLIVNGTRYELSANQYPGAVHPQGFQFLKEFRLDPFPTFVYAVGGVTLTKTIFMPHGANSTVLQYALEVGPDAPECQLELLPLLAGRDYHSLTGENAALDPSFQSDADGLRVQPYAAWPPLYLAHAAQRVEATGFWYRSFEYEAERERGLDFQEDLFNPCRLHFALTPDAPVALIASTEPQSVAEVAALEQRERARRAALVAPFAERDELVQQLARAADQFIVARTYGQIGEQTAGQTVVAGYPWFSDWGRDTMIAFEGLTLATGRYDAARQILRAFAANLDQGMLPNRFPDAGEVPEYNTVDATLWYVEAVRALLAHTQDYEFVRAELYDKLREILTWHERGTRYQIGVDAADGLLHAGEPGVQLTWMDAKVGDWVVTPRHGKPVEIQALWFNALCVLAELAERFGDEATQQHCVARAAQVKASFAAQFWNEAAGCLYDVVNDDVVNGTDCDASLRPNQILAVSLPHAVLEGARAQQVVATVERELLTPYGLRTLAAHDPRYVAHYTGGIQSRDGAYHQGTVWPWLLGPFFTAYLKMNGKSAAAQQQVRAWLAAFNEHFRAAGLGQVSEIFDAEAPHAPRGCIAQAWSVAELLRIALLLEGCSAG